MIRTLKPHLMLITGSTLHPSPIGATPSILISAFCLKPAFEAGISGSSDVGRPAG